MTLVRPTFATVILGWCVPIACALLLVGSYPPQSHSLIAWFALVPIAMQIAREQYHLDDYVYTYIGGVIFHLIGLDWMRTSYGATGISGAQFSSWLLLSLIAGVSWPIVVFAARWALTYKLISLAIVFPWAWLVGEVARSILFISIVESDFPWLHLGASQSRSLRVIQNADIGGVLYISSIVALVNGSIASACILVWRIATGCRQDQAARKIGLLVAVPVVITSAAALYGEWRLQQDAGSEAVAVCLVPDGYRPCAGNSALPDADIYLWSEVAWNGDVRAVPALRPGKDDQLFESSKKSLEAAASGLGGLCAIGCRKNIVSGMKTVKSYNSLVWYDAVAGYCGSYDKVHLVPWNEFTPWVKIPLFSRVDQDLVKGSRFPIQRIARREGGTYRVAGEICYDSCFSDIYRAYHAKSCGPPDIHVVATSERVDNTGVLQQMMLNQSQLRAIECRRSVVRNAAMGLSGVVDGNGVIRVTSVRDNEARGAVVYAPIDSRWSMYMLLGDWPIYLCIVVMPLGLVAARWAQAPRRQARRRRWVAGIGRTIPRRPGIHPGCRPSRDAFRPARRSA